MPVWSKSVPLGPNSIPNGILKEYKDVLKVAPTIINISFMTLASITEEIRKALDNDEFACGVFLDIQKVFDTVSHEILFAKLSH